MYTLFNWICWSTVIIIFFISGIYNMIKGPKIIKNNYKNNFVWITIPIFLIGIIELLNYENIHFIISYHKTWLSVIGILLLLSGTVFSLWSRWSLGRIWTISATIKEGHKLVISGPYFVSRNPIYTGLLTMLLGSVLINGFHSLLYYFIVAIITFEIKIIAEEKILIEAFGDEYLNYKKRIPRLVPNIFNGIKSGFDL